jgi:hypothetical protein
MPRKVDIGDIVEIPTNKGLAYAQFSHYHEAPPRWGSLLRVLPGFFDERPKDFAQIVSQKESFSTFFPLKAAVSKRIFAIAGKEEIPPHARAFPLFRAGNWNPATLCVEQWWLWDGEKSRRIERLSDEQLDWPIKEICNDLALIDRIEKGWTPRKSEELMRVAALEHRKRKEPNQSPDPTAPSRRGSPQR